jgi:glycosyltransferase involved in cell wall biosynthesis
MRILVLVHEYPPVGGGGGQVARDLCLGLANKGHQVRVLTSHFGDLPLNEQDQGVSVTRLRSLRREPFRAGLPAMGAFVITSLIAGLRMMRTWRADLIHVHFALPGGASAWLLSRITKIPYLLTAHLGDVPGGVPEKTNGWFRWLYPITPPIWRQASAVVAVSAYTRQLALTHYPVNIAVIPNGVDLSTLDPGPIKVNNPPGILFAGRFMPQKNPLQVVHTLSELRHLPWTCTMLGDGPLRTAVVEEIHRLDLLERFSLPGWVTTQQVLQTMRHSDLLFMPSLAEGLPVVGVQALAMGLGVVCGAVGGFLDVVDQGVNGYLVDSQNPLEYAIRLNTLLSDHKKLEDCRLSSRKKAQAFDLSRIVDDYESCMLKVIEGRKHS